MSGTDDLQALPANLPEPTDDGAADQQEAAERLHLPFEVEGVLLTKRLTMVLEDGLIEKVFYPVFPPNESAERAVEWLSARATD